jgi:hypothetical protein
VVLGYIVSHVTLVVGALVGVKVTGVRLIIEETGVEEVAVLLVADPVLVVLVFLKFLLEGEIHG